jgi:hypothetical protein
MPLKWKDEYHIIAEDGEARDWLDSEADARAALQPGDIRIDKVTYWLNDTVEIWSKLDEDATQL